MDALRGQFVLLEPLSRAHLEPMRRLAAGPRETFRWAMVPTPEMSGAYLDKALAQMERGEAPFETWRCFRVTLKTDERNARSRRAIERLGAHFDGVLRAYQAGADGVPRNTAYYTILAAEWPAVKSALQAKLR